MLISIGTVAIECSKKTTIRKVRNIIAADGKTAIPQHFIRRGRTDMMLEISKIARVAMAGAVLVGAVAGCASSPIPNEKIAVAKVSLQRAEQSGAPELAPVELATARDKLARAEKAIADRNLQPATELAEQANVDAQLAEARAMQQRSQKAAVEFDASMQALRQESQRSTPPTQ